MKIKMIIAAFSIIALLPGCYTQFDTLKQERKIVNEDYSYSENDRYESEYYSDTISRTGNTIINNYYYDGWRWYPRYPWAYSYYYPSYYWPSISFGVVYADPWFYDRYWYYDPWDLWCWTPYVYYPHPFYSPSYYYPSYYWRTPWYYVSDKGDVVRTKRDFGENRGSIDRGPQTSENRPDRFDGGRSGFDLPTGVGLTGSGGRSQTGSGDQVRGKSRSGDDTRSVSPRSSDRSGTGRGERGISRPDSRRERYEQPSRGRENSPPSSRDEGRSNDRGSRGETRTYTPPPPPPSAPPSSPPPSSPPSRGSDSRGGSNDSNQGSRGGNTRGGR